MTLQANIPIESALSTQHEGSHYSYALDEAGNARILRCISHERCIAVPDELDGHPVTALAHSSFAALDAAETILLPETITQIGWSAFASCPHLKRIVLPARIDHTDKTWLADCPRLADVTLPAAAEAIDAEFLKSCHPARLLIGANTRTIDVPPFVTTTLQEVAVDAANPYLSTDGHCLYSKDGTTLLRLLIEMEECRVQEGCRIISERAFAYATHLKRIMLPDSLQEIGPFAFLNTALDSFEAPADLRTIREGAFARCAHLRTVTFNDKLDSIGEEAFRQCGELERLSIPASVCHLGRNLLAETSLTACGTNATFSIAADNPTLFVHDGALYQRTANGLLLVDALDQHMETCLVHPGTTAIGENAFADHQALTQTTLPEGLVEIGSGAFSGCGHLSAINLPSTLRSIGTRGLFNTALESLAIPSALQHLGSCALAIDCTDGRVPAAREPSLRNVRIAPGNTRFFMESGILCERIADYARAVLYVGPQTDVVIPASVNEIGPYAFAGVKGLTKLVIHEGISHIGTLGLAVTETPHALEIEYTDDATNDRTWLRVAPICDKNSLRALRNALVNGRIDVRLLADGLDRMALYSRDAFERARYMIERLSDPHLLSPSIRTNYDLHLRRSTASLCAVMAKGGWNQGYDMMAALGYLNADTITAAIDAVTATKNVAATAYLIRMKSRCWDAPVDYSL